MKEEKYRVVKRGIDIILSLTGLILTSPILLLSAIAIRLESKGGIVYSSKRVGEHYKILNLLKFRTMYTGADKQMDLMKTLNQYQDNSKSTNQPDECPFCKMYDAACSPVMVSDEGVVCENFYLMKRDQLKQASFFKIANDPRVTRVGRFLRMTSIDELPQLVNILRGDISLVGNRPLPLYEAEKLTTDFAIERFNAPSGLTGLWQVSKRGKAEMSETERIELDRTYAKDWSLKTDMLILLKTIPAILQKENV